MFWFIGNSFCVSPGFASWQFSNNHINFFGLLILVRRFRYLLIIPDKNISFSLAGVSRSVTVTVAYIMTVTGLGWRDALNAVRGARRCANPNFGFQRQLLAFEHEGLESVRILFFKQKVWYHVLLTTY